jgi:hypothetical protein
VHQGAQKLAVFVGIPLRRTPGPVSSPAGGSSAFPYPCLLLLNKRALATALASTLPSPWPGKPVFRFPQSMAGNFTA